MEIDETWIPQPMKVFAIDPGPELSAYVLWDGAKILDKWHLPNASLLAAFESVNISDHQPLFVIERIASYGMPVGREIFETCFWTGRFIEAITRAYRREPALVERGKVKMHLCHSMKAKDSNIRQALIDLLGAPGTKKQPGVTYGVSGDVWAALALAVTFYDLNNQSHA